MGTRRPGMQAKILLITVCVMLFSMGLNTLINYNYFKKEYSDVFLTKAFSSGHMLQTKLERSIANGLHNKDIKELENACRIISEQNDFIDHAMVFDSEGIPMYQSEWSHGIGPISDRLLTDLKQSSDITPPPFIMDTLNHDMYIPVSDSNGTLLGFVGISVPEKLISIKTGRILNNSLIIMLFSLSISVIFMLFAVSEWVISPINKLRYSVERVAQGDFSEKVVVDTNDEIGELSTSFNRMTSDLESFTNRLEWHVQMRTEQLTQAKEELETEINIRKEHESTVWKHLFALESSMDGMAILDRNHKYVYMNRAHALIFGYDSPEELLDKPWTVFYNEDEIDRIQSEIFPHMLKHGYWRGEAVGKKRDGSVFIQEVSLNAVDGGGVVSVVRDITERIEMEIKLRQSQKMELFGQLAADVAHEVRNPLNAIIAISDALFKDFEGSAEYKPYLFHIRTQVNRLTNLMNGLLELGRPFVAADMEKTDISAMLFDTVNMWKQSSPSSTAQIYVNAPSDVQAVSFANRLRLQQAFLNVLDNACSHNKDCGTIRCNVIVNCRHIYISITDSGSGVPEDILQRVFEPFFTTRKGGTGLGLSIVKNTIEAHGGTVTINNNNPPPGCTVEISLPTAV